MVRALSVVLGTLLAVLALWLVASVERGGREARSPLAEGARPSAEPGPPESAREPAADGEAPAADPTREDARAGDPTYEELLRYREWLEPGVLAGIVLRSRAPLAGARVELFVGEPPRRWTELRRASPGERSTTSDGAGRFRFESLAPGSYTLDARLGSGQRSTLRVELPSAGDSPSVVIVLGSAEIHGRVYDDGGVPQVGATVMTAQLGPRIGGEARLVVAWTDASGAYRLPGLVAGRYWLQTCWAGDFGTLNEQHQITVSAGRRVEVDLGRTRASARWSGSIVDGVGVVPAGARVTLIEQANGLERAFLVPAGARFEVEVPLGSHGPRVAFPDACFEEDGIALEPVAAQRASLERDLVVPGARLEVALLLDGQPLRAEGIRLVREGSWVELRASPNGRFLCFGVPAGPCRLELSPALVLAESGEHGRNFLVPAAPRFVLEVPVGIAGR